MLVAFAIARLTSEWASCNISITIPTLSHDLLVLLATENIGLALVIVEMDQREKCYLYSDDGSQTHSALLDNDKGRCSYKVVHLHTQSQNIYWLMLANHR